ncbi:MAG: DUF2793 domain-containing protein [Aestuariivirga sp.]
MPDTPNLALPLIEAAQAQKHVTHNEALLRLDAQVQLAVIDRTLASPPVTPADGDRYLVAAAPTGAWSGHAGEIAYYEASVWRFAAPQAGWRLWVEAEAAFLVFDGAQWIDLQAIDELQNMEMLGINTTADTTNRLAVSSAAALFTHAGAGAQIKINKNAAADTASLLFQNGFSGRTEMGLAGDDDFRVKVSANGSSWTDAITVNRTSGIVTLTPNSITNAALADMAAATIKGAVSAGDPQDLTATQATALFNTFTSTLKGLAPSSGGGTTNFLRADGTWTAPSGGGVSDGDKGDITVSGGGVTWTVDADVVTNAKLANMATATFKGRTTAGTGDPEDLTVTQAKTLLNLTGTNSGDQTITLTGDVTGSGTASFAATIANDAVSNAKLSNMATATFKARITAATGDPEDITGTQATTLLDPFTSVLKGLAPPSGGGTTNFLRADGTWAAPGGGGGSGDVVGPASATDNAIARFDSATGQLIQNSGVTVSDGNEIDLPLQAAPTAPSSDRLRLFAGKRGGRLLQRIMGPSGLDTFLQPHFGFNAIAAWQAAGNSTTITATGAAAPTATGTATAANAATTNLHTMMRRLEYLVTTAATTAVAGFRQTTAVYLIGGPAVEQGGFYFTCRWGPATGVSTTTSRAFVGLGNSTAAPTDVEPSSLANIVGMGWDAADANIQFMHRGAGAVTKIDLGASFPVPTADRTKVYELTMFSPPGATQTLSYEVRELGTSNVATGTISANLPTTSTFLAPRGWMSVGGTSSVIGIALMNLYIETDF